MTDDKLDSGSIACLLDNLSSFAHEACVIEMPPEMLNETVSVIDAYAVAASSAAESNPTAVHAALKHLHQNTGHPSVREMVRILRHGGASDAAIEAARRFTCEVCVEHARVKPPPPAMSDGTVEFNKKIGVDVKYLPNWKPGQE